MKITSSKYLYSEDPLKKSPLNTLKECFLRMNPIKNRHYLFKVTVEHSNLIKEGDEVLMAEGIKLIVVKKFSTSEIVLRTKELHCDIPFIGIEMFLVDISWIIEEGVGIYKARSEKLIEAYTKKIQKQSHLIPESQPCEAKFNPTFCKTCLQNISGEHIHSFCKQGFWNTKNKIC